MPNKFRELYGSFANFAWTIDEYFSEDEYLKASNIRSAAEEDSRPLGQLIALTSKPTLILPYETVTDSIEILRYREHEWSHFRQYISTQLGIFLHRITGIQEQMTLDYISVTNAYELSNDLVPFSLINCSKDSKSPPDSPEARRIAAVVVWKLCEFLRSVLSFKTMILGELIASWNGLMRVFPETRGFLPCDKLPCQLNTNLDLHTQSCPDGHISVQDIREGFAKFREVYSIASHTEGRHAVKAVLDSLHGSGVTIMDYLEYHLGIPFMHPLTGALLDLSLLCFIDPWLACDREPLLWESIHPGLRFEKAVQRIQTKLRTVPDSINDVYFEAMNAYGITETDYLSRINSWISEADPLIDKTPPLQTHDPQHVVQWFYGYSFLEANKLRRDYPMIYCGFRNNYPFAAVEHFASVTRPPVLVKPTSLFIPYGAGRDLETGVYCAIAAISAFALYEISHYGSLKKTIPFCRKFLSTISQPESMDAVESLLRPILGSFYEPCIHLWIHEEEIG